MKRGTLVRNPKTDRFEILNSKTGEHIPLHCGACLQVKRVGGYEDTRIEMGQDWYLVRMPGLLREGLEVRR